MFYVVERSIVVIKPKQPFLDWINNNLAISNETLLDLSNIRIDCNSYLIPEINEIEDGVAYVDEVYEALFQLELASWSEDQNLWPQELSLKMFWEWFDIEISPTLIDLTEDDDSSDNETEELASDTIH
ncbi:MAG: hypothetical protein E6Q32_03845 [Neisseriales bacterium]|jgi:hypothetical protein|nr:MAG: hypothetical protein E6Q32_03845 [Neisseriales bacterium]HRG61739.1 hypothetical protein [Burkholderiales bacterium]